MGPGQNFLTRVGSGQFFVARVRSGRVSHLWFGIEFRKFPLKASNFSIFYPSGQKKSLQVGSESTRVKAGSASYLLRVKSKLGSGRVGSGPISSIDIAMFCTLYRLTIFVVSSQRAFDIHILIFIKVLYPYFLIIVMFHREGLHQQTPSRNLTATKQIFIILT